MKTNENLKRCSRLSIAIGMSLGLSVIADNLSSTMLTFDIISPLAGAISIDANPAETTRHEVGKYVLEIAPEPDARNHGGLPLVNIALIDTEKNSLKRLIVITLVAQAGHSVHVNVTNAVIQSVEIRDKAQTTQTSSDSTDKEVLEAAKYAASLANGRFRERYDSEPFSLEDGQMIRSSNHWVWTAIVSHGTMDIQAAVMFSDTNDNGKVIIEELISKDLSLPPVEK